MIILNLMHYNPLITVNYAFFIILVKESSEQKCYVKFSDKFEK